MRFRLTPKVSTSGGNLMTGADKSGTYFFSRMIAKTLAYCYVEHARRLPHDLRAVEEAVLRHQTQEGLDSRPSWGTSPSTALATAGCSG